VDIQREIALSWFTLAAGKAAGRIDQMRHAVSMTIPTDKHPVTPGVILPARDLLWEILLEIEKRPEALCRIRSTLRTAPNRSNALSGAARAANCPDTMRKPKATTPNLLFICKTADGDDPSSRLLGRF